MLINERLFKEIASRGVSQKTWNKMDEAKRKAYLEKNPTSRYAEKVAKEKPVKSIEQENVELKEKKDDYKYQKLTPEMKESLNNCVEGKIIENEDGSIDIIGDCSFYNTEFDKLFLDENGHLKYKFNKVSGRFTLPCSSKISSLEGCPKEVGGTFDCEYCDYLESLKGGPKKVGGNFYCYGGFHLKSLEGAPEIVGGSFDCSDCKNLESLEGAPKKVGRDFSCDCCIKLKDLRGAPEKVGRDFSCSGCKRLESLEGCPKEVGGDFHCVWTKLKDLIGAPEKVGHAFYCDSKFTEDEVRQYSNVKGKVYRIEPSPF